MRSSLRFWLIGTIAVILVLIVGYAYDMRKEQGRIEQRAALLTRGDPQTGRDTIARYGCGGCHDIPGVTGAHGLSAPPLSNFGARAYIAGELRNTPDSLVQWIMHPHAVEPKTAMPELGVTERDARDIAAYLYTLD
jgi:cytochrome c1